MSNEDADWALREPAAGWLQPLDGEPCGDNLEYDPAMQELEKLAAGKPQQMFKEAEPPPWGQVASAAADLMARTRDLRIALWWCRATLHVDGVVALPHALALLHGLLDTFWEKLHPLPEDDGDAFARLGSLNSLVTLEGLLGDVRRALLTSDRQLAGLTVREIEVALEKLPAREGESVRTAGQIRGLFGELPEVSKRLRVACSKSLEHCKRLTSLMNDRFGIERAVDLKPLRVMIDAVRSVLPDPPPEPVEGEAEATADTSSADEPPAPAARRGGGGSLERIESREDAVKALRLICAYLEQHEPTNPAQMLLRRAERMMERNFLQLVRELAPDALNQVAMIMGVDPSSIENDG